MYLDDGISRDSAPSHDYVPETAVGSGYGTAHDLVPGLIDPKAHSYFTHVKISQVSTLGSMTTVSLILAEQAKLTSSRKQPASQQKTRMSISASTAASRSGLRGTHTRGRWRTSSDRVIRLSSGTSR